eukprot:1765583-Lingulodinium_polyedra.AAC.1
MTARSPSPRRRSPSSATLAQIVPATCIAGETCDDGRVGTKEGAEQGTEELETNEGIQVDSMMPMTDRDVEEAAEGA